MSVVRRPILHFRSHLLFPLRNLNSSSRLNNSLRKGFPNPNCENEELKKIKSKLETVNDELIKTKEELERINNKLTNTNDTITPMIGIFHAMALGAIVLGGVLGGIGIMTKILS